MHSVTYCLEALVMAARLKPGPVRAFNCRLWSLRLQLALGGTGYLTS